MLRNKKIKKSLLLSINKKYNENVFNPFQAPTLDIKDREWHYPQFSSGACIG
jgi:hypothetical protein